MKDSPANLDVTNLRSSAEAKLKEKAGFKEATLSAEAALKVVHELQVHQIELEMQNEQLPQSQAETEANMTRYTEFFDFSPTSYLSLLRDGIIQDVNLTGASLMGLERSKLIGRRFAFFIESESISTFELFLKDIFANHARAVCEVAFITADRRSLFVHIEAIADHSGQSCRMSLVDITERRQAEVALLRKDAQYRVAIETSIDGFCVSDTQGRLIEVNKSFERLTGYSRDELLNMNVVDLEDQDSQDEFFTNAAEISYVGSAKYESRYKKKDGSIWPVQIVTSYSTKAGGKFYSFISDLTERKKFEELVWTQANFDALTKLPNRRMFHDRLEQGAKKSHRSGQSLALMLIDLDHFKEVNDTLGHDKGDILLIEAARRISECVRDSDTVARLGGDEFIVILSELDDRSSVDRIAQEITHALGEPFILGSEHAYVSASIGISLFPTDADDLDVLFKNADQAMYVAKNAGRNRFSYFTTEMQESAQQRMVLANDLRIALANDQFRVYYQPIVNMTNGQILKAEALIRWHHPEYGWVSPKDFIPLAEEIGLIVPIGDWVFMEAVKQVKLWRQKYHASFQISVNKSPVQIRNQEHISWPDYLQQEKLEGQSIVVEITEGLLLNLESYVKHKLLKFRDAGMQVALDDFGTGYSSLAYLRKFDIDYLKIDQSFVQNLGTDSNSLALCEAIIVMAHTLDLKVIAEGVETIVQRDLLSAAGCDYAQGYLYSKPVSPDELEKLLST